jgi:undecaprenyl-diphosphatase
MALRQLVKLDVRYSNKVRIPDEKRWLKGTAAFLAHSGDSWFWGAGLLALGLLGPHTWRPQIILLFLGIFFTAVTVLALKFLIKRPRPEGEWGKVYRSSDPHSFPSGHAARMFMLTVIMLLTGYWFIGLIMLVWALLVVISRVGLGVHYFSDVVVGGLIGVVMGFLAVGVFELLI